MYNVYNIVEYLDHNPVDLYNSSKEVGSVIKNFQDLIGDVKSAFTAGMLISLEDLNQRLDVIDE